MQKIFQAFIYEVYGQEQKKLRGSQNNLNPQNKIWVLKFNKSTQNKTKEEKHLNK